MCCKLLWRINKILRFLLPFPNIPPMKSFMNCRVTEIHKMVMQDCGQMELPQLHLSHIQSLKLEDVNELIEESENRF